jgi:hypothetical protein
MRGIRRIVAAVSAGALVSLLFAAPSSAQTDVYVGAAQSNGLRLRVLSTEVSVAATSALAGSDQTATATGTGLLSPLVAASQSTATVPPGETSVVPPNTNAPLQDDDDACPVDLPVLDLIDIRAACSSARASRAGGLPSSASQAYVTTILAANVLGGNTLPVIPGLNLDDLLDGVLNSLGIELSDALRAADIGLARTTSQVTTTPSQIIAEATASGGTIRLFPLPTNGPGGQAALIELSPVTARVTCDRASGAATPSSSVTPLRVTVGNLPPTPLPAGASIDLPAGLGRITAAAAEPPQRLPDGSVRQTVAGVAIRVPVDGSILTIEFSAASAGAGCRRVAAPPPPGGQLAPTGGGGPWLLVAGIGVLGLAVLVRRLTVYTRRTSALP